MIAAFFGRSLGDSAASKENEATTTRPGEAFRGQEIPHWHGRAFVSSDVGPLCVLGAQDPPCEAWRSMVTPTDQARSREGRVAGIGRGPLALPLPSPPLSPRALARLVRSHAPCAHTPPSKKKEGLRSDSSGRLGPPRCGPRFFLCQGRGSFTLKDDEGR